MKDCIFCKMLTKEWECHVVYEDDHVLAFLDKFPVVKGHTLVIPKVHAETLFGLDDEYTKALLLGVQKTMERIQETLGPDGFNLGLNHNEVSGQTVPHVHMHILPRWKDDGKKGIIHSMKQDIGDLSVEDVAKLFA